MKQVIIYTTSAGPVHDIPYEPGKEGVVTLFLPEGVRGPNDVVLFIASILSKHDRVDILTAYPDAINFVGELVWRGLAEAKVILHRPGIITEHRFDEQGVLIDDWPFGVLMPDHDAALAVMLGAESHG